MCFLKQLKTAPTIPSDFHSASKFLHQDTSAEMVIDNEVGLQQEQKVELQARSNCNLLLMNCLGMINLNSQMMVAMDQKLEQAQGLLDCGRLLIEETTTACAASPKRISSLLLNSSEKEEQNLFQTSDPLTHQLFGPQEYKYRLVVDGEFPNTLYKERNFALNVKLVDISSGKERLNGNIVNVCLGVCDDNAEWVNETKEGVTFLKGKIESELYHGTSGFAKMAARDVSRVFIKKTLNLVVYPKPTMLRYSGESSIEEHIDHSLIEPLVIHNISIKAKKRQ